MRLLCCVLPKMKTVGEVLVIYGMLLKASNSSYVVFIVSVHNENYQQVAKACSVRPSGIRHYRLLM